MVPNTYYIFVTVAECGNISSASEMLCLTPSALSHSIAKLERELNVNLFIRDKKGVKLTSDGRKMLEFARKIIDTEQLLLQEAANLTDEDHGSVAIGTICSVSQWWLPKIIENFNKENPNISLIVHQGSYQNIVDWLYSGKIDLGFLTEPLAAPFDSIPLHKEELKCITPLKYKPKNKNYISPAEMIDWSLINQASVSNIDTAIFLKKYNLTLKSNFFMEDDQSILSMVEGGLGFSIMPELVIKEMNLKVNVYSFNPREYRTICLSKLKSTNTNQAIRKTQNFIVDYLKNNNISNV